MGLYLSFPDGELYTATVSDFSGSDPLIYKEPLRTVQFDSKHLNGKLLWTCTILFSFSVQEKC